MLAPAGALVVWDSRMPHENFPNDDASAWRAVQYVAARGAPVRGESEQREGGDAAARAALWRELARVRLLAPPIPRIRHCPWGVPSGAWPNARPICSPIYSLYIAYI